ncbi:MAG: hypothetical protein D6788_09025 [Planctomycetota bacterium]|nr:MAG: hypothetical protein D6788_09025 [Planctomycetota bacterium]
MNIRLVILLVVAGGLAVYWAVRTPPSPKTSAAGEDDVTFLGDRSQEEIRLMQTPLGKRPLPGVTPDVPPELSIRVEVDPSGKKNRLYYYITEAHGYYVEEFTIDFFYKPTPETTKEDSPLVVQQDVQNYVKANETFTGCMDFTWRDLRDVGGSMGTDENWGADIVRHGRYREENPDPLPLIPDVAQCR